MGFYGFRIIRFSSCHRGFDDCCASLTIIGHKKTTKKIICRPLAYLLSPGCGPGGKPDGRRASSQNTERDRSSD